MRANSSVKKKLLINPDEVKYFEIDRKGQFCVLITPDLEGEIEVSESEKYFV